MLNVKDTRPLKDRGFQQVCMRKVVDYLNNNGFNHPVTMKTLQTPTSNEFWGIFEFFYHRLDGRSRFRQADVLALLKGLRCVVRMGVCAFFWTHGSGCSCGERSMCCLARYPAQISKSHMYSI